MPHIPAQTIVELISSHVRDAPESVALFAPGKKPLSYARLWRQMEAVRDTLNRAGFGRNDRMAVVLKNGPALAAAFVSIAAAATCAPLNPEYRESELDFYLEDLKAKALVVEWGVESVARQAARKRGIAIFELVPEPDGIAGAFTLAGPSAEPCASAGFAQAGDAALVLHTSGTTSRPKLVPLTQANVCRSACNVAQSIALTAHDRCLNVMPLFHIHGLIAATLSSLGVGASVVCTSGPNVGEFFKWLEDFRPTWYTAVPTIHQSILAAARSATVIPKHFLKLIRSSSASLPPQLLVDLEQVFGVPVIEAYGMTEAAHQMCSNAPPPGVRKLGSVGLPAGPEVAVMDDTGILLGAGATGEIVIRGANVTAGYEDNPEANESAFTNGWFRTGDLGYRDDDGYFFLTGRLKEQINRGGEKIAPREIDEVLLTHPAVAQAVAFAVPHARLGEDVAAAIVLRAAASATERDMRAFAISHLAPHKVPSRFVFVEAIPKGPTGKLQRIGLFQKLESRLKAEFVSPATHLEQAVARIWCDVLHADRIGTRDNFFSLGGDSLLATRVTARYRSQFDLEIPVTALFRSPTIAEQALLIEECFLQDVENLPEEPARLGAESPPTDKNRE